MAASIKIHINHFSTRPHFLCPGRCVRELAALAPPAPTFKSGQTTCKGQAGAAERQGRVGGIPLVERKLLTFMKQTIWLPYFPF